MRKKLYLLKTHVPEEKPQSSSSKEDINAYKNHVDNALETTFLMLAIMNYKLQK